MNRRAPNGFPPLPRDGETDRENHKKLQNVTFTLNANALITFFLFYHGRRNINSSDMKSESI